MCVLLLHKCNQVFVGDLFGYVFEKNNKKSIQLRLFMSPAMLCCNILHKHICAHNTVEWERTLKHRLKKLTDSKWSYYLHVYVQLRSIIKHFGNYWKKLCGSDIQCWPSWQDSATPAAVGKRTHTVFVLFFNFFFVFLRLYVISYNSQMIFVCSVGMVGKHYGMTALWKLCV